MKLSSKCRLHRRRGKYVLMVYASQPLALEVNSSFAFLWEQLSGKDFAPGDVSALLQEHYGLEEDQAASETEGIIYLWESQQLVIP